MVFTVFFLLVSGRFCPLKPRNPHGIKGKNPAEAWAKVLVTSGYTNYARNLRKPGPKYIPKFTRGISADGCN